MAAHGGEVEALRRDRTVLLALRNPANRKRSVGMTPKQFRCGFTNTMNDADADASHERYYVPPPAG